MFCRFGCAHAYRYGQVSSSCIVVFTEMENGLTHHPHHPFYQSHYSTNYQSQCRPEHHYFRLNFEPSLDSDDEFHRSSICRSMKYSGACFSKVSKLFGPFTGTTIPFISSQRRGSKPSLFAILFVFLTTKTC